VKVIVLENDVALLVPTIPNDENVVNAENVQSGLGLL